MKTLLGLAAGLAAGYSFSRFMEAKAAGVPLSLAFKLDVTTLLTPVAQLRSQGGGALSVAAVRAQPAIDVEISA